MFLNYTYVYTNKEMFFLKVVYDLVIKLMLNVVELKVNVICQIPDESKLNVVK